MNAEGIPTNLWPEMDKQPPKVQMNNERRIAVPNFVSGDLQELDEKVKSMMEASQNLDPVENKRLKFAKYVEKKDKKKPSATTLRQIILKGSLFPVMCVEKSSGQGRF